MNWFNTVDALAVVVSVIGSVPGEAPECKTYMALMSDGAKLATHVYLPPTDGPAFPVVLHRTPYGKANLEFAVNAFTNAGMAFVVQDVRGLHESAEAGPYRAFQDDGWGPNHCDGADTVNWLLEQNWCNGKVATWGHSASAMTSVLLAGSNPPIVGQIIYFGHSSHYGQFVYQGGVLRGLGNGWVGTAAPEMLQEFKQHPAYDAFWTYFDAETRAAEINVPALHIGGWFDIFQQGAINNFVTRQVNGGPGARGKQRLLIGPWHHGSTGPDVGDVTFPGNWNKSPFASYEDIMAYQVRHMKRYLEIEDSNVADEPIVTYYTMGASVDTDPQAPGNEWRGADTWPPFPTIETPYYLAPNRSLLADSPPIEDAGQSYDYDPNDPYPTHGGAELAVRLGPLDQRYDNHGNDVTGREDVLRFRTPKLARPLEVTGAVHVRLYVSSDAPDTDFSAKLIDVYPDGRQILILDGIRRLKFRNGFQKPDPLPPGEIGALDIDLWSTSIIFNAGHQIGLHICSSNTPRFAPNPNNGQDFLDATGAAPRVAHNTVHMGSRHPSALLLPLRAIETASPTED